MIKNMTTIFVTISFGLFSNVSFCFADTSSSSAAAMDSIVEHLELDDNSGNPVDLVQAVQLFKERHTLNIRESNTHRVLQVSLQGQTDGKVNLLLHRLNADLSPSNEMSFVTLDPGDKPEAMNLKLKDTVEVLYPEVKTISSEGVGNPNIIVAKCATSRDGQRFASISLGPLNILTPIVLLIPFIVLATSAGKSFSKWQMIAMGTFVAVAFGAAGFGALTDPCARQ